MDIRGHYEILGYTPSLKAVTSDCMRKIISVFEIYCNTRIP
jgi:hypothetical protein